MQGRASLCSSSSLLVRFSRATRLHSACTLIIPSKLSPTERGFTVYAMWCVEVSAQPPLCVGTNQAASKQFLVDFLSTHWHHWKHNQQPTVQPYIFRLSFFTHQSNTCSRKECRNGEEPIMHANQRRVLLPPTLLGYNISFLVTSLEFIPFLYTG